MTGRYDDHTCIDVSQDDGTTRPMSTPRISVPPRIDVRYVVRAGDRLDLLADAVFADSLRWWSIADANPVADALRLEEPGTELAVPDA